MSNSKGSKRPLPVPPVPTQSPRPLRNPPAPNPRPLPHPLRNPDRCQSRRSRHRIRGLCQTRLNPTQGPYHSLRRSQVSSQLPAVMENTARLVIKSLEQRVAVRDIRLLLPTGPLVISVNRERLAYLPRNALLVYRMSGQSRNDCP